MELNSIHSFSSHDELSLVNHDSASLQTLNEHENMYSVAENPTDVNFSIVEKNSVTITLHCTLLQEEMLQNFKTREIIYTPLNFQFMNVVKMLTGFLGMHIQLFGNPFFLEMQMERPTGFLFFLRIMDKKNGSLLVES